MWCDRIIRNVADPESADWAGRAVDYVDLSWDQCRNVFKGSTRGGELARVLLSHAESLRHGDVLMEDDARAVVVNVMPSEMIVVTPVTACDAAILALELGNLHWPTQVRESEIIFPNNETALALVEGLGLAWTREVRRFHPASVKSSPGLKIAAGFEVIRGGVKAS